MEDKFLNKDEVLKLDCCSFFELLGSCNYNELILAQWVDYNCINNNQLTALLNEVNDNILLYDDECKCGECYLGAMKYLKDFILKKLPQQADTDTPAPQQITLPPALLTLLQQSGFIENAEARPLKWTATNKTTKGQNPNKKSLFDLLCLLEYPDNVIKDRTLLNSNFVFSNGKGLSPQNYTDITDYNRNIIRPIISEYHTELETIVKKSKEK